jgi:hypothetical protein
MIDFNSDNTTRSFSVASQANNLSDRISSLVPTLTSGHLQSLTPHHTNSRFSSYANAPKMASGTPSVAKSTWPPPTVYAQLTAGVDDPRDATRGTIATYRHVQYNLSTSARGRRSWITEHGIFVTELRRHGFTQGLPSIIRPPLLVKLTHRHCR